MAETFWYRGASVDGPWTFDATPPQVLVRMGNVNINKNININNLNRNNLYRHKNQAAKIRNTRDLNKMDRGTMQNKLAGIKISSQPSVQRPTTLPQRPSVSNRQARRPSGYSRPAGIQRQSHARMRSCGGGRRR